MADKWSYDYQELTHLYLEKFISILGIAKLKGVGYKAVRNALLREGIPLRKRNTKGLHERSDSTKV